MKSVLWAVAFNLAAVGVANADSSPFHLTVEARVGPYLPDLQPYKGANALDVSHGLTAFQCSFGNQIRPAFFVSPQLSVFDMFGTVLLGAEGGFYSARGRKLLTPKGDACGADSETGFQELNIFPLMLTATYRFDWALDKYRIPLVPYVRLGVGGAGWVLTEDGQLANPKPQPVLDTNGNIQKDSDGNTIYGRHDPAGFSFGGKLALGMMVALDFLEPMRALHARAKGIYSHSFLFLEVAGFDAGLNQNLLLRLATSPAQSLGIPLGGYLGPTLIVGTERLPLITAGLAVAF